MFGDDTIIPRFGSLQRPLLIVSTVICVLLNNRAVCRRPSPHVESFATMQRDDTVEAGFYRGDEPLLVPVVKILILLYLDTISGRPVPPIASSTFPLCLATIR